MTEKKNLSEEELQKLKSRHIRSFSGRKGRISNAQEKALENIFPLYAIQYEEKLLNYRLLFNRQAATIFEIGPGMGETSAQIAFLHPEINFIACEVFPAGIGAYSKRLQENNLQNVRLIQHDAVDVIKNMIAPQSLDGIHVYFPDPWRKARHHKRRLINPTFTHILSLALKKNGYIHCATDWENYAEQMLEVLSNEPLLQNLYEGYALKQENPLTIRPRTKFQARGENLGHDVFDLVFIRKDS